jgi:hypothetical protein
MTYKRNTCDCCGAVKYDGRYNLLVAISNDYKFTQQWESMVHPYDMNSKTAFHKLQESQKKYNLTEDEMFAIFTGRL